MCIAGEVQSLRSKLLASNAPDESPLIRDVNEAEFPRDVT